MLGTVRRPAQPRRGASGRARTASTRATRPGCGGGCWSRSAGAPRRRGARRRAARARADPAGRARPGAGRLVLLGGRPARPVPALVPGYADWYPPEVPQATAARAGHRHLHGRPADDRADGRRRAGGRCVRFADGCRCRRRASRPDDAWHLLAELDELLDDLYGAAHLPAVHRPVRRTRQWEADAGPPTSTTPPPLPRGRPARAPSPTATAAPAPSTPPSTRTASTSGRAATATSTRELDRDRGALRRHRLDGRRCRGCCRPSCRSCSACCCARATPRDPQIMFGAIGDATCDRVPLQIGQFESDNRMDDDLGRIVLEGGGGGQMTESYELAMYFMARHTALDCFDQARPARLPVPDRRRDGLPAGQGPRRSRSVIGDDLREDIPLRPDRRRAAAQVRRLLHPAAGAGYAGDAQVLGFWRDLLGQNVDRARRPRTRSARRSR